VTRDRTDVDELVAGAERLDALAETAELMGDVAVAARFRSAAVERRLRAMRLLDE
jgi:hypothetical protein